MAIKIGINGFGRIGRMVFRAAVENFGNAFANAFDNALANVEWQPGEDK